MADEIITIPKDQIPVVVVPAKAWYQSKTIWTAIITAVLGSVEPVSKAIGHPIVVPVYVFEFLASVGLYSLRTGDKPIV